MSNQIIDSKNGNLQFENDFVVSSQTTVEEIVNYLGNDHIEIRDMNNGCKNYTVRNIKIYESYFIITFYFNNDVLTMLDFIVSDKLFVESSWNDWSEKEELEKQKYYDQWLTKQIGNHREFTWGSIGSFFDSLGGSSNIVLKYN